MWRALGKRALRGCPSASRLRGYLISNRRTDWLWSRGIRLRLRWRCVCVCVARSVEHTHTDIHIGHSTYVRACVRACHPSAQTHARSESICARHTYAPARSIESIRFAKNALALNFCRDRGMHEFLRTRCAHKMCTFVDYYIMHKHRHAAPQQRCGVLCCAHNESIGRRFVCVSHSLNCHLAPTVGRSALA